MPQSEKKPIALHQGKLLEELSFRYNQTHKGFADAIGYSEKWLYSAFKEERLKEKHIKIISMKMDIPENYFDGISKLPNSLAPGTGANEDSGKYKSVNDQLREENSNLKSQLSSVKDDLLKAHQEIISLQQQVINLMSAARR